MAWMQNPKFYGIKRGLSAHDGSTRARESQAPWGCTVTKPVVLAQPGVHTRVFDVPNPSAFAFGNNVRASIDPHKFLVRGSGHGGAVTTRAGEAVPKPTRDVAAIGRPPPTHYAEPRANPPNTSLRRAYEMGDLPCILSQKGTKRVLVWRLDAAHGGTVTGGGAGAGTSVSAGSAVAKLDYSHYLPLFCDGLREEENPLFFIASQGIVDLVRAAPEKVAAVVPHLVVPLRYALVTRRREVLVRVVEALKLIASCDAHLPGGGKAGRALVPFFRQLLPVINIFASRYRGLRGGIDGEARNRTSLEEVIQNLLNVLEVNGGPEAYLNIKYVVPQYTSVNLV
jgi:hypothetical protein